MFDEKFVPYDMGWDQIGIDAHPTGGNPDGTFDFLSLQAVVTKPGYIYIYFLNEEQQDIVEVYFDDLTIKHLHGPVVQADDYYPFGLTFNSYQRENSVDQRWKFQGQEHIDDLGLNWDSFKWRNHQPDIGRFFNLDPLAEQYYYNSPYAFSENKVVSHVELEGLEAQLVIAIVTEVATRAAISESISNRKHVEARGVAEKVGGIHNGRADAWRHASWSKESSEAVGKTWTMLFGLAHEVENLLDGSPLEETSMDLTNNKKGRAAANTDEDLIEKAGNGELQTIDPENDVDYFEYGSSNDNSESRTSESRASTTEKATAEHRDEPDKD